MSPFVFSQLQERSAHRRICRYTERQTAPDGLQAVRWGWAVATSPPQWWALLAPQVSNPWAREAPGAGDVSRGDAGQARQRLEDARRLIADNADPGVAKQVEKTAGADTFRVLAMEWLSKQNLARATLDKATWIFEQLLFPELGDRPIRVISAPDLLTVLRKIKERGAVETAHRAKQRASQVFRYAIATGRAAHDPAGDLRGALTPKDVEHRAAITEPKRVGELLRAIDGYVGQSSTHYALRLAPYVFVLPGELRAAEWAEFDFERAEWRIPAEWMKMGEITSCLLLRRLLIYCVRSNLSLALAGLSSPRCAL